MKHASLCTGIGACELAATWLGWENMFSCEIDSFCNRVLKYHYPNSVHYGNIFGQNFSEWKGRIDVLSAGFPCQPFSVAGKQLGSEDDRYLWPQVFRVIREIRPAWFVGENVAGIRNVVFSGEEIEMGGFTDICGESYKFTEKHERFVLDRICEDIETIGYSVQTVIIPACAVGAPHRRDRVWIIAHAHDRQYIEPEEKLQTGRDAVEFSNSKFTSNSGCERCNDRCDNRRERQVCSNEKWNDEEDKSEGNKWEHGVGENDAVTSNSYSIGLQRSGQKGNDCSKGQKSRDERFVKFFRPNWQDFPTQSPICLGNDGFPGKLFDISFSKWRINSIKAFGNSMVPQVVFEIFKMIESVNTIANE